MAVGSYLFDDTGVGQIVNVGGSTQQQSSFEASGHRLSKRPQQLREEALKVWNQTCQIWVDLLLQM